MSQEYIRILYAVQKRKRIFRGQFQSCHCSESILSVDRSFKRWTTSSAKATSTKLGTCSRTKGSRTRFMTSVGLMHEFANFFSMSSVQFFRAGSQKGEFFIRSTTPPILGRKEFDVNESDEPIELFDVS